MRPPIQSKGPLENATAGLGNTSQCSLLNKERKARTKTAVGNKNSKKPPASKPPKQKPLSFLASLDPRCLHRASTGREEHLAATAIAALADAAAHGENRPGRGRRKKKAYRMHGGVPVFGAMVKMFFPFSQEK